MSVQGISRSGSRLAQVSTSLDLTVAVLARATTQSLGRYGLLISDVAVLLQLYEKDGLTLQQLASGTRLQKPTASRTVKRLLIRNFLTCGTAAHFNQGYSISLTRKGMALVERRLSAWSAAEFFPESVLSTDELTSLVSLLDKIAGKAVT